MERLTERNPYWINDETWERACESDAEEMDAVYHKLKEYEDLEERGLLIRLPCKVGDKVYYVQKCLAPSCKECKGFITVNNCYTEYKARIFEQKFDFRHIKAFGKTVFLTREEAEASLAEMNKKENINE